jgi:hypothetical protein
VPPDNVKVNVKKAGRKRTTLGWALLTLGVLVAGVWVGSGWWWFQCPLWDGQRLCCEYGSAGIVRFDGWEKPSLLVAVPDPPTFRWNAWLKTRSKSQDVNLWLARYKLDNGDDWHYGVIVLWPIPLLLWTSAALLLRSGMVARRSAIIGKCKSCGYDLAGLAAGAPCPECRGSA